MARKHEAQQLLQRGSHPGAIARSMGVSVATIVQYLQLRVGEGQLRLSDILYSWPQDHRLALESARMGRRGSRKRLQELGLEREELEFYITAKTSGTLDGDMYQNVRNAEVALHRFVEHVLKKHFVSQPNEWWRSGVPTSIRVACAERREIDDDPVDSIFAYTNLIELASIVEKRWRIFADVVQEPYRSNRALLEKDFRRLNGIRNAVMHPVKGRDWKEDDFILARGMATWAMSLAQA